MKSQTLLKQIEKWHEYGEHEKIAEMLFALPESERDYNITSMLARALNNMGRYEEALALLESVRAQGEEDDKWHFRVGYSLFYINGREAESIPYFERAIELGDDYPTTYELLNYARSFAKGAQLPEAEDADDDESDDEPSFTPKAYATLSLNMRLQPQHRDDRIADGIDMMLRDKGWGCVSGGGTMVSQEGEPQECDIEIDLVEDSEQMRQNILSLARKLEVAKGSILRYRPAGNNSKASDYEREYPIGKMEGIAVYINGTDLPDEIYKECDINVVYDTLFNILSNNGGLMPSYWAGPTETALYFYGEGSAKAMLEKVMPFLNEYPLCRQCRTVLLAHEEPAPVNSKDVN